MASYTVISSNHRTLLQEARDHRQTFFFLFSLKVGVSFIYDSFLGHDDVELLMVDVCSSVPDVSSSFTRSFVVVLGFNWTFQTKIHSSLELIDTSFQNDAVSVWSWDFCIHLFVQMLLGQSVLFWNLANCLKRRLTWCMLTFDPLEFWWILSFKTEIHLSLF